MDRFTPADISQQYKKCSTEDCFIGDMNISGIHIEFYRSFQTKNVSGFIGKDKYWTGWFGYEENNQDLKNVINDILDNLYFGER